MGNKVRCASCFNGGLDSGRSTFNPLNFEQLRSRDQVIEDNSQDDLVEFLAQAPRCNLKEPQVIEQHSILESEVLESSGSLSERLSSDYDPEELINFAELC